MPKTKAERKTKRLTVAEAEKLRQQEVAEEDAFKKRVQEQRAEKSHKRDGLKMRKMFGKKKDKAKLRNLNKAVQKAAGSRKLEKLVREFVENFPDECKHAEDLKRLRPFREPKKMSVRLPRGWTLRQDSKDRNKAKIGYPGYSKKDIEFLEEKYEQDLRLGEVIEVLGTKAWPREFKEILAKLAAIREKDDAEDAAIKAAAGQVIDFPKKKTKRQRDQEARREERKKQKAESTVSFEEAVRIFEEMQEDK